MWWAIFTMFCIMVVVKVQKSCEYVKKKPLTVKPKVKPKDKLVLVKKANGMDYYELRK